MNGRIPSGFIGLFVCGAFLAPCVAHAQSDLWQTYPGKLKSNDSSQLVPPTQNSSLQPLQPMAPGQSPTQVLPGYADDSSGNSNVQKSGFEKQDPAAAAQTGKGEMFEPGKVLAIVAGQPILAGDLLLTINEIIQIKAADAPDFVKTQMRERGIRELLPRTIETKMFYHQAVQMLPDPSKVGDIKKDLYKQLEEKQLPELLKKYQAKNVTELDGRLRMLGSSWRAVKDKAAEQEIARYAISSNIKIETEISHDELIREYRERIDEFHLEDQVKWEQLMVRFDRHPNRAAAKRKLAKMGNEVVYGADLKEIARRDSEGFFAPEGGQVDWTKPGSLTNVDLEKRLFTSPVGKLSDIIETREGFHIIRVQERQFEGYIPFEETQDQLRESILQRRQEAATKELLENVKKKIPYEILIDGIEF